MDKSRPSFPPHDPCGQIDTDAMPIATDVQPAADRLDAAELESSTIVYCGTAQEISEGFAIALRAMGLETNFLPRGHYTGHHNPKQGG